MKPIDRLYMWSLILTLGATCLLYTGLLLPNWWIQKDSKGITTRIFGLFGDIHCSSSLCYPSDEIPVNQTLPHIPDPLDGSKSSSTTGPMGDGASTPTVNTIRVNGSPSGNGLTSADTSTVVPEGTTMTVTTESIAGNDSTNENISTSTKITGASASSGSTLTSVSKTPAPVPEPVPREHPANAGWLVAGRVFGGIGMVVVLIALLLQMSFLLFPHRRFQIVSFGFLVAAALVSFIAGFIFINKFSALTKKYVTDRPPGALTYTSAAPGCILISSLLCVVAAVFTMLAFHPPGGSCPSSTKITREKKTPPNTNVLPGETIETGDQDQLLG